MRPEIENTPLPIWMRGLRKDSRGYPIPFIALVDKEHKPHFTVNNEMLRQMVIAKDWCGICGKKLVRWRAVVGGPISAFLEQGAYIDPPMHIECCQYALKVCPYLALPSYTKSIEGKTIKPENLESGMAILVDNTMLPDKPTFFVMAIHLKCERVYYDAKKTVVKYLKPKKPYVRVEYWQNGSQMEPQDGEKEAKRRLYEELASQYPDANRRIEESIVQSRLARSA